MVSSAFASFRAVVTEAARRLHAKKHTGMGREIHHRAKKRFAVGHALALAEDIRAADMRVREPLRQSRWSYRHSPNRLYSKRSNHHAPPHGAKPWTLCARALRAAGWLAGKKRFFE